MRTISTFGGLALLLLGIGCSGDDGPGRPEVRVPERAACPTEPSGPTAEATLRVQIITLCLDDAYGDYGVPTARYVVPSSAGVIEHTMRAYFECCPNRADDITTVTVEDGTLVVSFPETYRSSEEWGNVSTTGGSRAFFAPLVATAFQFPDVQQLALRFGDEFWWPSENDAPYEPIGRDADGGLPLEPRPVDPDGPVAAVGFVADGLNEEHVVAVAWMAGGVQIETDLFGYEAATAARIRDAVWDRLAEEPERWCHIAIAVTDLNGDAIALEPRDNRRC